MAPTKDGWPSPKSSGIAMPIRENIIGLIYMNNNKIYIAERSALINKNCNDHLIKSLNDIKKIFTMRNLKEES